MEKEKQKDLVIHSNLWIFTEKKSLTLNLTFTTSADNSFVANPIQPLNILTHNNYDAPLSTLNHSTVEEVKKVISTLKTKTSSGILELVKMCNE